MRALLQEIRVPIPGGAVSVYLTRTDAGFAVHTIARQSVTYYQGQPQPFPTLADAYMGAQSEARTLAETWPGAGEPCTVFGPLAGFVSDTGPAVQA